ncbi:MAG: Protein translocase subunit SecD, partial [Cyanobacteriota bacterium]
RINGLGVAESTLQTVGDNQLVLQLPGEQDPSRAARVLGSTALLEFRAQKAGSEEQMRGLLQLKRQAQAVLSRLERRNPDDQTPPPAGLQAEQLAQALQQLGVTASSPSTNRQPSPARTSPPPAGSSSRAAAAGR